jgi:hypothetical protein
MLIINYIYIMLNDPLSRFPQGGKAELVTPSPVGEGWEGGIILKNDNFIQDSYHAF